MEDSFSMDEDGGRDGLGVIQAHDIYCTLYFLLLHQLHLKLWGLWSRRLEIPLCKEPAHFATIVLGNGTLIRNSISVVP